MNPGIFYYIMTPPTLGGPKSRQIRDTIDPGRGREWEGWIFVEAPTGPRADPIGEPLPIIGATVGSLIYIYIY